MDVTYGRGILTLIIYQSKWEPLMKNIILCCDGTANEFAREHTNVVKLYYALARDPTQIGFYHPGVGTMEAVGALTSGARQVTKLLGLAFGYGLEADVRDAYVYLMNHFDEGDRVFLFGFSRGAYTVRAVAALLHMYGLISTGNEPLVPYSIRMMLAVQKEKPDRVFDLAREFRETFSSRTCCPHFVGVWDTVSSVGWVENPLKLPYTANNPDIAVGRHAVGIDERRAFFRQNLWRRPPPPVPPAPLVSVGPRDMKQLWFAGVHCDVGGGYPEQDSGLSKIALEWMFAEAYANGMKLDKARTDLVLGRGGGAYAQPDANAKMHNSLTGPWWPAEFVLKKHYDRTTRKTSRRMNLFRRRTIDPGASIHESVYQRAGYAPDLPPGVERVSTLPLP
jgi:uncharacterized protein (DUF2235 family)